MNLVTSVFIKVSRREIEKCIRIVTVILSTHVFALGVSHCYLIALPQNVVDVKFYSYASRQGVMTGGKFKRHYVKAMAIKRSTTPNVVQPHVPHAVQLLYDPNNVAGSVRRVGDHHF